MAEEKARHYRGLVKLPGGAAHSLSAVLTMPASGRAGSQSRRGLGFQVSSRFDWRLRGCRRAVRPAESPHRVEPHWLAGHWGWRCERLSTALQTPWE